MSKFFEETKICSGPLCKGKEKPLSKFWKNKTKKDGFNAWCIDCCKCFMKEYRQREYVKVRKNELRHVKGEYQPLGENKYCGPYLGVFVAENVLSKVFKNVEKMPYGNPGYDFICNKGYKIDVKSASLTKSYTSKNPLWKFKIKKNILADYFLLIGFDNREDLNPLKIWLIPGIILNNKQILGITNILSSLQKWEQYELKDKLKQVITCCDI